LIWLLFLTCVCIWGSSFILIKKTLLSFSPGQVTGLRLGSAALAVLPFVGWRIWQGRRRWPWGRVVVAALSGNLIPAFLFPLAQTKLSSATAGTLNGLTPLFTLLLGAAFFGVAVSALAVAGIVVGFAGAVMLVLGNANPGVPLWQDGAWAYGLLAITASALYGFNVNFVKRYLSHLRAIELTALAMFISGFPALFFLLLGTDFFARLAVADAQVWWSLAAGCTLGAVGTAFALFLFFRLLSLASPLFAASNTYFIPVIALSWGLWDGESLGWHHLWGLLLVLVGVFLVHRATVQQTRSAAAH
jgi:drug/metabolite transporter (DMT)-like permease